MALWGTMMVLRGYQNHVVAGASDEEGLEGGAKLLWDLEPKPLDTSVLRVVRRTDDGSCRWGCGLNFGTLHAAHQKRKNHEFECQVKPKDAPMAPDKERQEEVKKPKTGEEDAIGEVELELRSQDRLGAQWVVAFAAAKVAKEAKRMRVNAEKGKKWLT